MFYVLLKANGDVDRYPYTLADLRLANPGTSFAAQISDEVAAEFRCFPVAPTTQPPDDYTVNLNRTAVKKNGNWTEQWVSTPATPEEITERTDTKAQEVRTERNDRLAACDWTQLGDSPLTPEAKAAWVSYRENLRTVPEQPGFPWNVTWPLTPGSN